MDNNKIDLELRVALDTTYSDRIKSIDLNTGYYQDTNQWELIVKYVGDLNYISENVGFSYVELLNGYGIIRISPEKIYELVKQSEILYVEKPRKIYTEEYKIINGTSSSCMSNLFLDEAPYSGNGVLVGVIDSGIDYQLPIFIDAGISKITELWDQSISGNPPYGYNMGYVFSREDINKALANKIPLLTEDISGHGTGVASIIANISRMASFIIVKLNTLTNSDTSITSNLIMAIDYVVKKSIEYNMPLVLNLSYGNNYGDHNGNSILEQYIASISNSFKITIVTGSGNEGISRRHSQFLLGNTSWMQVDFSVSEGQVGINLQIWSEYSDSFDVLIRTPSGEIVGPFLENQPVSSYNLTNDLIKVVYSSPSPINTRQETYVSIIPRNLYIEAGIWNIFFRPKVIVSGRIDIWLPVADSTSGEVFFLNPSEYTTLTIPSTTDKVISVAAYNSYDMSYAPFSGRGYTVSERIKPDISAPGVDIDIALPNGGYGIASGTSFAAPFVSAASAILMEYGIVLGNDPFLYGDKVKAHLIRNAKQLPGFEQWPNEMLGWGALCLNI